MVVNTEDFQNNSNLAFSLSRNVTLSFESVRLCDRAVSAWFSYSCNENLCNVGGGGGDAQ